MLPGIFERGQRIDFFFLAYHATRLLQLVYLSTGFWFSMVSIIVDVLAIYRGSFGFVSLSLEYPVHLPVFMSVFFRVLDDLVFSIPLVYSLRNLLILDRRTIVSLDLTCPGKCKKAE